MKGFPELLDTKPGKYEQFQRVDSRGEICTIDVRPINKILFSSLFYIDETIINKIDARCDKKYGKPETAIKQINRTWLKIIQPLKSMVYDKNHWLNTINIARKGDIQIDLTDTNFDRIHYNLIINHENKSAKMLSTGLDFPNFRIHSMLDKKELESHLGFLGVYDGKQPDNFQR